MPLKCEPKWVKLPISAQLLRMLWSLEPNANAFCYWEALLSFSTSSVIFFSFITFFTILLSVWTPYAACMIHHIFSINLQVVLLISQSHFFNIRHPATRREQKPLWILKSLEYWTDFRVFSKSVEILIGGEENEDLLRREQYNVSNIETYTCPVIISFAFCFECKLSNPTQEKNPQF